MRKMRFGLLMMVITILLGSLLPSAAASAAMSWETVPSSMAGVEEYFSVTNPDNVSVVTEEDYPVISMKSGKSGHWIISKKPVLVPNYTYTVELAGEAKVGAELSVFVGADPKFLNGVQVYLTKRGNGAATLDGAIREAGLYKKVMTCSPDLADVDNKATYFKIELQVFEFDIDVYLNDEYLETITVTEEVQGHVGVRCSSAGGELRIKSMSLVEEASTPTDAPATQQPTEAPTEQPTPSADVPAETQDTTATQPPEHTQKVENSTPATTIAPTQDAQPEDNTGISMGVVGGIVLGVVAVICGIAVAVFFIIKKKNTP